METAGAKLRKLRLEKGLSLEEVHKKTNIHLDILKSIEEDSLVNLNPVYIKGFVKIYCGFLGVDPGEYLSVYKGNGKIIPINKPSAKDEELFWGPSAKKSFLKPQMIVIVVSILTLLFLILGVAKLAKSISQSRSKKARQQLVLPKPTKKTEKKTSPKPKVILPSASKEKKAEIVLPPASATSASTMSLESGVRIGLHALDDCWVLARLDGKIVFQNILKKGRFESWSAKDKVELSLGSAGAVRLEVNGKLIPSLGRKGQVLKNILITKDGLKVGK